MRKIVFILTFMICMFNMINIYSDDNTSIQNTTLRNLEIIDEKGFVSSNTVSREECINAIMKVIGITDEDINSLSGADFYAFADTNPYSYSGCAYRSGIAYGEECVIDYSTFRTSHTGKNVDIFFFPSRAVTIRETIAFMVRCLGDDSYNISNVYANAVNYGLLYAEDDFIKNIDAEITPNEFSILLERMLQKKRYKYYDGTDENFVMKGFIDNDRTMTYQEMLEHRVSE